MIQGESLRGVATLSSHRVVVWNSIMLVKWVVWVTCFSVIHAIHFINVMRYYIACILLKDYKYWSFFQYFGKIKNFREIYLFSWKKVVYSAQIKKGGSIDGHYSGYKIINAVANLNSTLKHKIFKVGDKRYGV